MKCISCGKKFTPRRAYHLYCDGCYADMMAERRSHRLQPRNRRLEMWTGGDIVVWVLVVGVPAVVVYGVGKVVGWW